MTTEIANIGTWNTLSNYPETVRSAIYGSESFEEVAYPCSAGVPTIGAGFALLVKYKTTDAAGKVVWKWRQHTEVINLLAAEGKSLTTDDVNFLKSVITDLNEENITAAQNKFKNATTGAYENKLSFTITKQISDNVADALILDHQIKIKKKLNELKGKDYFASLENTRELVALVSMHYSREDIIGKNLSDALRSGNRYAAWFEIRYVSNKEKDFGIANRRYRESDIFGLFSDPSNVSSAEADQALAMYLVDWGRAKSTCCK